MTVCSVLVIRRFSVLANMEVPEIDIGHLNIFPTKNTLNSFAPIKNKIVRANQMPFITKGLSREIIKRSRLRNNFLRKKTEETLKLYIKQSNKHVSLLKKA